MAKLQIPYYTIRRNGRAFWEPRPHMRALGFYSVPCAKNRDGTIKPHEIIRARWSVSLRSNSRNLEDRQGYTGTSRGLVWGGECVKVIDSRIDGRLLTWAFIEIVQCPQTTNSGPTFERRAMSGVRSLFW